MEKLTINLSDGDKLFAEKCLHIEGQIAIGIEDSEGNWVQDLAVVEKGDGQYKIYVFDDELDEGWTHTFKVKRAPK